MSSEEREREDRRERKEKSKRMENGEWRRTRGEPYALPCLGTAP